MFEYVLDATANDPVEIRRFVTTRLRRTGIALKDINVYASEQDAAAWVELLVNKLIQIMDSENFRILTDLTSVYERYRRAKGKIDIAA